LRPKTEELLYFLLWACELALRPTFRNLTSSFEEWAYRNGFHRQLAELERQKLLESQRHSDGERLHRLTETGRLLALGSRDPVAWWERDWDGMWRMVLFDVPQRRASDRVRLRRSLAMRGFGFLQNSAWITPDPLTVEHDALAPGPVDVESLILFEARPCAGETDEDIVAGAWDFEAINERYIHYGSVLQAFPREDVNSEATARQLQIWIRNERQAWIDALKLDPLLPKQLQPASYLGGKAWTDRLKIMAEVSEKIRGFNGATMM
jgi:phenylacetic acid degradation operon negative regulatory protein